jgi:hypothetical protein
MALAWVVSPVSPNPVAAPRVRAATPARRPRACSELSGSPSLAPREGFGTKSSPTLQRPAEVAPSFGEPLLVLSEAPLGRPSRPPMHVGDPASMTTQSLPCTFGAVTTSASCRARGGAGQAGRPRLTSPHGAHPRPQHRRPGRPVEPTDEIRRRPGPPRRRAGCAARMRADGYRSILDLRPPTLCRATACVIHVVASGMKGPVLDTYPIPANEIRTLVATSNTATPLSPCNGDSTKGVS